jgi:hypothetical protein
MKNVETKNIGTFIFEWKIGECQQALSVLLNYPKAFKYLLEHDKILGNKIKKIVNSLERK